MERSLEREDAGAKEWRMPPPPERDDIIGPPVLLQPNKTEDLQKKAAAHAIAHEQAEKSLSEIPNDLIAPARVNERRLKRQREVRAELETITKEREGLRFWQIGKRWELSEREKTLRAFLRNEEVRAKKEILAMEDRRKEAEKKMRKERELSKIPSLEKKLDRILVLKRELAFALDRYYKRPESDTVTLGDRAAVDVARTEIDRRLKEIREIEDVAEGTLLSALHELRIPANSMYSLIREHKTGRSVPQKISRFEKFTQLELLLRQRMERGDVQKDPKLEKWARTAHEALALFELILKPEHAQERKKAPPITANIETPEAFYASSDEELLGSQEQKEAA